jgi:hypothetical protein
MKERKFCSSRLMGWVRSLNFWPNFKALCLLRFVCLGEKKRRERRKFCSSRLMGWVRSLNFWPNFKALCLLRFVCLGEKKRRERKGKGIRERKICSF